MMNIFTKFQKDWTTIVDFLLIAKFLARANNFGTPSTYTYKLKRNGHVHYFATKQGTSSSKTLRHVFFVTCPIKSCVMAQ